MNDRYYDRILKEVDGVYEVAGKARAMGFDPAETVEIPAAQDLASRVETLVGPAGVAERLRELDKDMDRYHAALRIIDEIIEGRFGAQGSREKTAEQCIRTSLTMLTEGVTAGGTEGVAGTKIRKNPDESEYLCVLFAGPIRSAGGTAAALGAALTGYTAKQMGLANYRPTEDEVERYVEEVNMYHMLVSRLQYKPSDDDVKHIIRNCPICIDGDPTTLIEVALHKNLPRVDTNQIRGGACLVIGEGIAQKATKLLKLSSKYGFGWEWLEGIVKVTKKSGSDDEKAKPLDKYLSDIVGGRPIFAYPSEPGAFRLRYGKARNNGIMAKCIHPATMEVLDEFPVIGTQLKLERPGKGAAIGPCDTIEPPVVRLKNGEVLRVDSVSKAIDLKDEIEEILFLGDMLVTYGDFRKSGHALLPSGNCEEWWEQLAEAKGVDADHKMSAREAVAISKKYGIPLHPAHTHMYENLAYSEMLELIAYLKSFEVEEIRGLGSNAVLRLKGIIGKEKRYLERICLPHKVLEKTVIIDGAEAVIACLLGEKSKDLAGLGDDINDSMGLVQAISDVRIIPKAPTFIGARMGRPEKAKERLMSPPPHVLFPIGEHGGKVRDITKAKGKVSLELLNSYCPKCGRKVRGYKCPECGVRTKIVNICPQCSANIGDLCPKCGRKAITYSYDIVDIREELEAVSRKFKMQVPDRIKGVKGIVNNEKYYEPLEKGFMRAKNGVYVFKDGTVRFDATDMPITHFKPAEIGVSVARLRELGYDKDWKGNDLAGENQVVELQCQDIIIPNRASEYFLRTTHFVDDLLENFYGLPRFYGCEKPEDLLGHFVIGLAPHISAGVLGRIIGFTRARVCYAHPYWHTAKRRNTDGDEDSIMLLLDAFLNFSRKYLPSTRGGTMDASLVLTTRLNPEEVDDEVFEMETVSRYPLEFYEATLKRVSPYDVKMELVKDRLGKEEQYHGLGFTHDCTSVSEGPVQSRYTQLKTMAEKVNNQLLLAKKIMCVDEKDVAKRILNFHFMRDIYGNLRAFGQQTFRCVGCNAKYRRPPLVGKCTKCGGKLLLTVNKGGIEKYLKVSQRIAEEYGLGDYVKQRLAFVEKDLETIFPKEKTVQQTLANFV